MTKKQNRFEAFTEDERMLLRSQLGERVMPRIEPDELVLYYERVRVELLSEVLRSIPLYRDSEVAEGVSHEDMNKETKDEDKPRRPNLAFSDYDMWEVIDWICLLISQQMKTPFALTNEGGDFMNRLYLVFSTMRTDIEDREDDKETK